MSVNGGRRKGPRPIWLIAGGAAVLAGAMAWPAGQGGWAALPAAVAVLLPVAAFLADKAAARSGDLDIEKVADRLADLVRDQWDKEATRRGVGRPPLEVFWQAADADLVHTWPDLLAQAAGGRSGPASAIPGSGPDDLAGHGALLAAYDRSPCGRLVVLGEPGAGKTVLLLRFVLDLIGRRQPGEPVPLLVPLASWNPDGQSLYSWLEGQILREYPHLSAVDAATGDTRAGALLRAGLILPVLDGLDEIRAGGRDQALASISDGLRSNIGLVLSCRTDEFRAAVHPRPDWQPIHLDGAAGIHITPLTSTAIRGYLLAGAGNDGPTRWAQALTALANPSSPVAQALTTPLTAFLASTIYNPRPRESTLGLPNPTDLCTLLTAAAIEQHLLAGFIPAAYRPHPDQPTRWITEQATRYLTFLARHLEHRLHTTSLAWWELSRAAPRAFPILFAGLTVGLTVGLIFGPVEGLALGLVAGLAGGLGHPRPSQINRRLPRRADFAGMLTNGLAVGLPAGFIGVLAFGLAGGLTGGLVGGLAGVLVNQLGLSSDADIRIAIDPYKSLINDRESGLAYGIVFGIGAGFIGGLVSGLADGSVYGLAAGLVSLFEGALVFMFVFGPGASWGWAWIHLSLARLWLAARRQQPLHLIAFLEDAHARGVLRQAGAVWEFRHASLQRYLAGPP